VCGRGGRGEERTAKEGVRVGEGAGGWEGGDGGGGEDADYGTGEERWGRVCLWRGGDRATRCYLGGGACTHVHVQIMYRFI